MTVPSWYDQQPGVAMYRSLVGRSDREACNLLLQLMQSNYVERLRRDAFGALRENALRHNPNVIDIYSNAIEVALVDPSRHMFVSALCSLSSGTNSTRKLLQIVEQEYRLPPKLRGLPTNPWFVLRACKSCLLNQGALEDNFKIIEEYYEKSELDDVKYYLSHVIFTLRRKVDVQVLLEAVTNASSPQLVLLIIRDLMALRENKGLSVLRLAHKGKINSYATASKLERNLLRKYAHDAIDYIESKRE